MFKFRSHCIVSLWLGEARAAANKRADEQPTLAASQLTDFYLIENAFNSTMVRATSRRTRRASVLPTPTKPAPPKCTSTTSTRQTSQVEVPRRLFTEPKTSLLLFIFSFCIGSQRHSEWREVRDDVAHAGSRRFRQLLYGCNEVDGQSIHGRR